jgi:hypothetical protein
MNTPLADLIRAKDRAHYHALGRLEVIADFASQKLLSSGHPDGAFYRDQYLATVAELAERVATLNAAYAAGEVAA